MVFRRLPLFFILSALLVASMVLMSLAGPSYAGKSRGQEHMTEQDKKKAMEKAMGRVKHSGKAKRNKRIKINSRPGIEIVEGTISGIDKGGIYMDGEYFKITYSDIKGQSGKDLTVRDLHFGLKARVTLYYGTIEKTTIYGLKRIRRLKTPQERREYMKARKQFARSNRAPDKKLPKDFLEYEDKPPADLQERVLREKKRWEEYK